MTTIVKASQPRPLLLVRRPSPLLSSGQLTHLCPSNDPPTPSRSLRQWQGYCDVYRGLGWDVIEVESADECPDGVFLEDAMVIFPSLQPEDQASSSAGIVVVVRSGTPARRGEYPSTRRAAEQHLLPRGYDIFDFYQEDPSGEATLDGGDILKILPSPLISSSAGEQVQQQPKRQKATVYVGQSSRTNSAGLTLLRTLLEPRGWVVLGVPVEHHLHLKSAITALPDGQVIGHMLPRTSQGEHGQGQRQEQSNPGVFLPDRQTIVPIQEELGIAVVDVSSSNQLQGQGEEKPRVLLSAAALKTKEQLEAMGYQVITVDIGDFEKMEGW